MNLIEKARDFAYKKHNEIIHKRKYTNDPYTTHLENVVSILKDAGEYDETTIASAYLHDVIEDTRTSMQELYNEFGEEVFWKVYYLTDLFGAHTGNRMFRKMLYKEHLKGSSYSVQTIKLGDLIDNTSTIVQYDPDFAKTYMKEKKELLEILTNGNPFLWERANNLVVKYYVENK